MKDPTTGRRAFGRTRWRRFGILLAPAFTAVAVMMYLVAAGVIAVSFSFSGIPFTLNADNMSGNGFVQYATVVPTSNTPTQGAGGLVNKMSPGSSLNAGPTTYDASTVTVLHDGTIKNLDQTICVPSPVGGNLLVELKAGAGGTSGELLHAGCRRTADDGDERHLHQHQHRGRRAAGPEPLCPSGRTS